MTQQIEILMKQRLLEGVETQGRLRHTCGMCTDFYATQTADGFGELRAADELSLLSHLLHRLLLLHFGLSFHALGKSLRRESFTVCAVDGIVNKE